MPYVICTLSKFPNLTISFCQAVRKSGETAEIIIADDGLPDDLDLSSFGLITRIKCPAPFNFSRNANLCLAARPEFDVFLANDDANLSNRNAPGRNAPVRFLEERSKESGIGIVSAAIIGAVGNPLQSGIRLPLRDLGDGTCCFVAVYLSRPLITQLGPLDERFDGYGYEDNDYSLRSRLAGFRNVVDSRCVVEHVKPSSTYRRVMLRNQNQELRRAGIIFQEKWKNIDISRLGK